MSKHLENGKMRSIYIDVEEYGIGRQRSLLYRKRDNVIEVQVTFPVDSYYRTLDEFMAVLETSREHVPIDPKFEVNQEPDYGGDYRIECAVTGWRIATDEDVRIFEEAVDAEERREAERLERMAAELRAKRPDLL